MSKLDTHHWCDLVRGVASEQRQRAMRDELDSVARAAHRQLRVWQLVADTAAADLETRPPDYAVRSAKAIAGLERPAAAGEGLRKRPFEVIFDSLLAPAPAGTRRLQAFQRQLVVEAGSLSVDVRVERESAPAQTVVVGQAVELGDAEPRPLEQLPILVVGQDGIAGRTVSGPYGEFQAEGLPDLPLRLCLLLADGDCLEIPLDDQPRAGDGGL